MLDSLRRVRSFFVSVSIYDLRSEFTDIVKGRYLGLINSPRDATDAGLISGGEGPREYQFVPPGVGGLSLSVTLAAPRSPRK